MPTFGASVSAEGKLQFPVETRRALSMWCSSLAGQKVVVTIKRERNTRSDRQNRWLWGVAYEIIVEDAGYELHERAEAKEYLHYKLVKLCFGSHFDPRLGEEVPNVRSSKLSKKEFGDYMDWLVRHAAKEMNGMVIPLPGEMEAEGAQS